MMVIPCKIDSNHTIYHVHNAETANPVDWYLISGEADCGEADCGEGEWIPRNSPIVGHFTQILELYSWRDPFFCYFNFSRHSFTSTTMTCAPNILNN